MIVVDASVAAKWVLVEEHSEQAKALYRVCIRHGEPIVAPPLLPFEVTNTVRQVMRRTPALPHDRALALLDEFLAFTVDLRTPDGLHRHALRLAADFDLAAAYDAHYLALAQHFGCDLWTADQRFRQRVSHAFPFVRWIGDYAT